MSGEGNAAPGGVPPARSRISPCRLNAKNLPPQSAIVTPRGDGSDAGLWRGRAKQSSCFATYRVYGNRILHQIASLIKDALLLCPLLISERWQGRFCFCIDLDTVLSFGIIALALRRSAESLLKDDPFLLSSWRCHLRAA